MTEGLDKTPFSPYISTSSYWEDQTGWATENNVQAHLSPIINISGENWRISKKMFSSFSRDYWLQIPTWKLFPFVTRVPRLEMPLDLKRKNFCGGFWRDKMTSWGEFWLATPWLVLIPPHKGPLTLTFLLSWQNERQR